jgi:hypothetical protein
LQNKHLFLPLTDIAVRNDLVEEKKQSWRSFFEQNQRSWLDDSKPKQRHSAGIFLSNQNKNNQRLKLTTDLLLRSLDAKSD